MNELYRNNLRKLAKVISFDGNGYWWDKERSYVKKYIGQTGVVVDYSNSHGECYGLVFPNEKGYYGRTDSLEIFWFDPIELEILNGI
jgi:hypothetical protein